MPGIRDSRHAPAAATYITNLRVCFLECRSETISTLLWEIMKKGGVRTGPAIVLLVASLYISANAQALQLIPTKECTFTYDSSACFTVEPGVTYTIGKDVVWLDEIYRFCLQSVTQKVGGNPVRVVLALDKSNSMCGEPPNCEGSMKNDTANKRIDAAHLFVENLRVVSPTSELAIVNYASTAQIDQTIGPLRMQDLNNVQAIHNMIDSAACLPYTWTWSLDKQRALGKTADTYTGSAVEQALELIDTDYNRIKDSLDRHIIILTDGDWFGPSPDSLIKKYRADHPNREVPQIHGIFLSDSARHVQYGHPSTGLFRGTCDPKDSVNLSLLEMITDSTGGSYFPGTRPETIIKELIDLLAYIIQTKRQILTSAVFTNTTTGKQATGTVIRLYNTLQNQYLVTIPRLELAYDTNLITITKTIDDPDSLAPVTAVDTIRIVRDRITGTTPSYTNFSTECATDTALLSISRFPSDTAVNSPVTITASISPEHASRFAPNDIRLRAITAFPDNDQNTLSLYHFDRSLKDSKGTRDGSGTPTLSSQEAAFGYSLSDGSCTVPLPTLDSDFTIELWIRPGAQSDGFVLLSGNGTTFKLTQDNTLSFSSHIGTAVSTAALDTSAWSHVAVSRKSGTLTLYLNGIPVSTPSASSGSITAGTYQIGPVGAGYLDELRISNTSRTAITQGVTTLQLPVADNMQWTIGGNQLTSSEPTLPFGLWQTSPQGSVTFTVTSTTPRYVIVNFFHETPAEVMWSKNSDRILFHAQGLTVTPQEALVNNEGIFVTPAGDPLGGIGVTAILRDIDGDGYIDRIDLHHPKSLAVTATLPSAAALVQTASITLGDKTLPLKASGVTTLNDSVIAVSLDENSGALETGWDTASVVLYEVSMTQSGAFFEVTRIIDGSGPVVESVTFHPDSATRSRDTLRVRFSEPIRCSDLISKAPSEVFTFYDNGTEAQNALNGATFVETCSNDTIGHITIALDNNNIQITLYEDSLGFIEDASGALDLSGNSASGRKVPVQWHFTESVRATTYPNPFIPGKTPLGDDVRSFYSAVTGNRTYGTVISIHSASPLRPRSNGSYGRAAIYDAIGNPIKQNLEVGETGAYGVYGIYWDGRNEHGRFVGPGTYLAIISIQEESKEDATVIRKKVGVRR